MGDPHSSSGSGRRITRSRVTSKRIAQRYADTVAPSSVPRLWRRLAQVGCIAVALVAGMFLGSTAFDYFKQVYPIREIGWADQRAVKPIRQPAREFAQRIQLERRFLEDTLHMVLPRNVKVYSVWQTCGEADCVRPSLDHLMLFTHQIPDEPTKDAFVQRVCNLSSKYFQANIARVQWGYDGASQRCVAKNWPAIEADIKSNNVKAMLAGLFAAILSAGAIIALGLWLLRVIERRIDEHDREISIEN